MISAAAAASAPASQQETEYSPAPQTNEPLTFSFSLWWLPEEEAMSKSWVCVPPGIIKFLKTKLNYISSIG